MKTKRMLFSLYLKATKFEKRAKMNKVGKPLSWLPPYQTVRALLRHTAYPYVTSVIKRMRSRHFAS
ncbi:hypothetical protein M3182_23240, partial [Mesobacillus maritimus]|uniref:hypothetical protein n=1 Tax=Mesobacillus maritimus TaxID=1643336 RepID=UPI00203FFDEC